jgi:hypothetical protein
MAGERSGNWFLVSAALLSPRTVKNRVHVGLVADDREKEIARLVALGGTRGADLDEHGHTWTVMADPEANAFCIAHQPAPERRGRLRGPHAPPSRPGPAGCCRRHRHGTGEAGAQPRALASRFEMPSSAAQWSR